MPLLSGKPPEGPIASRPAPRLAPRLAEQESWPSGREAVDGPPKPQARRGLLETCSNPACRSGWLHLWRSRSAPVFEDGWSCSPVCTATLVEAAVRREFGARGAMPEAHRHRIPLGLMMLEQGWISAPQLRQALEAQKNAKAGRLGHWLVRQQGVSEQLVTRALGLQWSCPVLPAEQNDSESLTGLVPRLFLDAFAALPMRLAAGKVLYLGFEDRLDPVLALGVERMTGLRVECGLVQGSHFRPAHARVLSARFPAVELVESVSDTALSAAMARSIERVRPRASRLVRVHDCLWLRMYVDAQAGPVPGIGAVKDLIGSVGGH